MRRSQQVLAPILAATAAAVLTGCRGPEMQRCVDETNKVVDPSFCQNLPGSGNNNTAHGYYGGGGYHYYYGGGGSYTPGTVVSGGSTSAISGHSYSTSSGTARGGFGSSFGGGEGGGHGGGGGE